MLWSIHNLVLTGAIYLSINYDIAITVVHRVPDTTIHIYVVSELDYLQESRKEVKILKITEIATTKIQKNQFNKKQYIFTL